MKIVFRVDSSSEIGSGHLMRCLTLAEELRINGHDIWFFCRALPGNLIKIIQHHRFNCITFSAENSMGNPCDNKHSQWLGTSWEKDAKETIEAIQNSFGSVDWIIVDHYALDVKWEKLMRKCASFIMVIDDLADRSHDCNILLDQNFFDNMNERYRNLIPENCKTLLGPQFSLIRDEFIKTRLDIEEKKKNSNNVLLFFGGSDPTNETLKILRVLETIQFEGYTFDVVVGQGNAQKNEVKRFCDKYENLKYHCQVENIATLMNNADFAVCSGGSFTWERYCLGLQAIVIAVAYNQVEICGHIAKLGIDFYIGESENILPIDIITALQLISMRSEDSIKKVAINAMGIVDGLGKVRIRKEIFKNIG